jgi:flagellum-specific peptidoglycan hydrolase FlgJ
LTDGDGGGGGPGRGAKPARRAGIPDRRPRQFFDTLYPPVHALAQRLGIDETWLLGLSAYESGWLGPHNRDLNDPFGVTHGGGPNAAYASITDAVASWEKKYGPIVRGATSREDFAQRLLDAKYNTRNKN